MPRPNHPSTNKKKTTNKPLIYTIRISTHAHTQLLPDCTHILLALSQCRVRRRRRRRARVITCICETENIEFRPGSEPQRTIKPTHARTRCSLKHRRQNETKIMSHEVMRASCPCGHHYKSEQSTVFV